MNAINRTLEVVSATHPGTSEHACHFCIARGVTCGAERVLAGVQAVLDLHSDNGGECYTCMAGMYDREEYPCATVRLLTGQEA